MLVDIPEITSDLSGPEGFFKHFDGFLSNQTGIWPIKKTMLAGASYLTRLDLSDINSLDLTARRKEPSII